MTTPKVRACAADGPVQILVLLGIGAHQVSGSRNDLNGAQAVDREPKLALEPPHASTQGQAADAGVRHDANRANETMGLSGDVQLAQ